LPQESNVQLAPADGKLGVLIPGIGAVSTTFMAGVEAVKRGLGLPIGSLTQLATIRLGKRTDGRSPYIRDFVPLAGLNDLCFGVWDIYEDTAYEAAAIARVLDLAPNKPKHHLMVVNLSGRGDKDLDSVARHLGSKAR